jgi:hypothetical protein
MEIHISYEQGRVPVTVFHIKGDLTEAETLHAQAQQAFEDGMRYLLLDLREVPFISSSGLRALHRVYMLLRTDAPNESDKMVGQGIRDGTYKSSHLKLLKPSKAAMEVLNLTGYDMFLEIHQDLKEAIASF